MKVIKAQYAGACYGVQRALNKVISTLDEGEQVSTLGPLIHNPQVVKKLASRGVRVVDTPGEAQSGFVVIRSHGVTPQMRRKVEERGLSIVDATCPHVSRAQKAAADLARRLGAVVVVGEFGHPEVEGLVAYACEAGGTAIVATCPDDLPPALPSKAGVVVQTTQTREALESVVNALCKRGTQLQIQDTVCFATRQRQDAAAALVGKVDAVVVIGGRNSSNTTQLADICAASCKRTYHIETTDEIDPAWFEGCKTVGVTAGASTPAAQIDAVIQYLEAL